MKEGISNLGGWAGLFLAIIGWIFYTQYPEKMLLISALESVALGLLIYYFITHFTHIAAFSKKRATRMGTNSLLMTFFFIGILAILAVLFYKHHARFDLSDKGKFSLSPQTIKILKSLKRDIKITGFVETGTKSGEQATDLLNNFRYQTPRIQFDLIDPVRKPAIAKEYGITQTDTMVLEEGKQETRVRTISEEELINAIIRVNQDQKKIIYFLEGHGEHLLSDTEKNGYSFSKGALEKDGYEVRSLLLLQEGKIPDNATVLIIGGPMTAMVSSEKTEIDHYLNKGGKALFLVDPESKADLEGFLEKWGVTLHKDLIIDPLSRLFGGDFTIPVVNSFPPNEITQDLKAAVFFPVARSIQFNKEKELEIDFKPLAESGPNSWGETKIRSGEAKYDPGEDYKGPLTIAAALSFKKSAEKPAKWIVVGNSDFAANNFFRDAGNGDLFLNMVSWLAEEKALISVRSEPGKGGPIFLTNAQGKWFFYLPVIIMPGVIFFLGVRVWKKRRNK